MDLIEENTELKTEILTVRTQLKRLQKEQEEQHDAKVENYLLKQKLEEAGK